MTTTLAEIVQCNGLLPRSSIDELLSLQDELNDTMQKRQLWRTEVEARYSVLNDFKFPTASSKYWQAVREQAAFTEELLRLIYQFRRNDIKMERIKRNIERQTGIDSDLNIQELEIDLEEAEWSRANMIMAAKDRLREIKMWSKIKSEVEDGTFDTTDVGKDQLITFAKQYINMMQTVNELTGPGEKANIMGQFASAIKGAIDNGVIDKVLDGVEPGVIRSLGINEAVSMLTEGK